MQLTPRLESGLQVSQAPCQLAYLTGIATALPVIVLPLRCCKPQPQGRESQRGGHHHLCCCALQWAPPGRGEGREASRSALPPEGGSLHFLDLLSLHIDLTHQELLATQEEFAGGWEGGEWRMLRGEPGNPVGPAGLTCLARHAMGPCMHCSRSQP